MITLLRTYLRLSNSYDVVSPKNIINVTILILFVNFPCLDGDVPRSTSYGVCISQLVRFARASVYVADFSTRNKFLTQTNLKEGYEYHNNRKTFF